MHALPLRCCPRISWFAMANTSAQSCAAMTTSNIQTVSTVSAVPTTTPSKMAWNESESASNAAPEIEPSAAPRPWEWPWPPWPWPWWGSAAWVWPWPWPSPWLWPAEPRPWSPAMPTCEPCRDVGPEPWLSAVERCTSCDISNSLLPTVRRARAKEEPRLVDPDSVRRLGFNASLSASSSTSSSPVPPQRGEVDTTRSKKRTTRKPHVTQIMMDKAVSSVVNIVFTLWGAWSRVSGKMWNKPMARNIEPAKTLT
mmetsp:Transcript_115044/g.330516  ORF Transcript_115044/g.330516 Transcript_115044/m.330516 type:complete len:254 (+) Transcript_115044:77-838(+)